MPTFETPEPLLASNPDLLPLAKQTPERLSDWFDTWVALLRHGERDPRSYEMAKIYRIGFHTICDKAAELNDRGELR